MTSPFNITTATNSIMLNAQRTGKASFTVTNTSGAAVRARARITSPDTSIAPWFTIDGEIVRGMAPAATTQYTVTITVPPTAAPKDYTFSLLMVDEGNPDENYTDGPGVRVTVPAPLPVPVKKPFPWWIVAVAVVVVLIVIIAIVVIVTQNNQAKTNAQATQNAITQTAAAVFTLTAQANAQATQTSAALTAQANTRATQTAFALTQTALAPTVTRTPTPTNTARPPQFITVRNTGGFVARFSVSYDLPGAPGQSQSTGDITAGTSSSITVPGSATNVAVTVTEFTGFSWNTACTRSYGQSISVNIEVTGTTFSPSCNGG